MENSPFKPTDLNEYHQAISDKYANHVLTNVNDHVVRISVMTEDFYWHYHPNSDETFIVLEGTMFLDLETGTVEIGKGQMITVAASVRHRTRPKGPRSVNLTIELADMETVRVTI
ncbi:cupin domain-containing protein [Mucilaginibacter sp.]|jgi:mannose-6-phosphate isomerase-like protein (cupin superfamily)|uniref:cupin domain-containing protein n=1 Tax=Mucilaginibacter sp. TaxID=1882438 RepID=UPI0035613AF4